MAMHIDIVPNRNSPPTVLLRQTYREGKKVVKRTLANLSSLPSEQVEMLRRVLKGDKLAPAEGLFDVVRSRHHGHVQAVLEVIRRLGFDRLLCSRPSRERDLVVAMVVARVLRPNSKLATTRWWHDTTLPSSLGVEDADEDELYGAMDWLLEHQREIERKLAGRHLQEGSVVLYDLTSSYFEGETCPLAALGHNRDGKRGKLQVNYGLLADSRGCPIAVQVFAGNTGDPLTLLPQVRKVREEFGIEQMVLVGDRGMITQKQIDALKAEPGIEWITALRSGALAKLIGDRTIRPELFDERNIFEFVHPDYPGERMMACRNPYLARLRVAKRQDLLNATVVELEKVRGMAGKARMKGQDRIGVRVGKVLNKYKVGKHFDLVIGDESFEYSINEERVALEAALDGVYVVRTSAPETRFDRDQTVRTYKDLSQVERAFRTIKGVDLLVRPIRHRTEERVRAHIFLCMLAYYVQWHMLQAWRPLLFADECIELRATRDPVAPAERSEQAMDKVHAKRQPDGTPVHSFTTLLNSLATIVENTCRNRTGPDDAPTFALTTTPSQDQQKALNLLKSVAV